MVNSSPPQRRPRGSKDAVFEILNCTKTAMLIRIRAEWCQKYVLYRKRRQIKILEHSILYEKVSGRICLSPPRGKLGAPKMTIFGILKCTKNSKFDSL